MNKKKFFSSLRCLALAEVLLVAATSLAQPAKGANKFLGNITTGGQVRPDFLTYWNQITPEWESKWGNIEGTRNIMNWAGVDRVKNFAEQNKIPWKFHTLVWGSALPGWLSSLSQADQLAEVTQWFDLASQRYPNVNMIDVVNEGYPLHSPPPYKEALGGDGATGFDWIINAFKMARQRWPHAILIYNDYYNIEADSRVSWTVKLLSAMKKANAPIDAIGCQAHAAYNKPITTLKSNLDKIAACGYPIFITEYDINEVNDSIQKNIMQEQFTLFWNHPKVVGITLWGYVVGRTWRTNTGLLKSDGTERPALTWLKNYVKNNPNPPNDFPNLLKVGGGNIIT